MPLTSRRASRGGPASSASTSRSASSCPASPTSCSARPSFRRMQGRTRRPVSKQSCAWCRSEEHTSELQSQSNLVCRLLLEKKKKKEKKIHDVASSRYI